jgi:hypothetical protein
MGYAPLSSDFYLRWFSGEPDGLTGEHISWCWEMFQLHGYDKTLFYDRKERLSEREWITFATDAEKRIFFCIFDGEHRQVAAFWMDMPTVTGRQAFVHFTLLVPADSVDAPGMFRAAADWLLENTRARQLLGLTPACLRNALSVVYSVGFKHIARLKSAVFVRGKERDAILTMYGR